MTRKTGRDTEKQRDSNGHTKRNIIIIIACIALVFSLTISYCTVTHKKKQQTQLMDDQIEAYSISVLSNENINAHI